MTDPIVVLSHVAAGYGQRALWNDLDLTVERGEFLVVLGANGTGKTTLLRMLLGLQQPTAGEVHVLGRAPRRGDPHIGYLPQQHGFDEQLPLRGVDLIRLGLDGHRWGVPLRSNSTRARVAAALADVGANSYANQAIGRLSGGEQQRLRLAQALVADPVLLLADEPLLSLDPAAQQAVAALLDQRRTSKGTAVVLVTHEINPLLPYADRVLYLANGQWAIGPTREVLTSETLTRLYGAPVDVLDIRGRLIIVGGDEASTGMPGDHPHHVHDDSGRHVH